MPALRHILVLMMMSGLAAARVSTADPEERNWLVERDVAFLAPERTEKLDLYIPPDPKGGGKRPAIVIIHGGGWKFGDKADDRETEIAAILARAGYVCASINYTLATKDTVAWPRCIEDCRAAVSFLRAHADKYAIDPDRIGAIGGSAGGTMALLLATRHDAKTSPPVNAVVALYPPTDLLTVNLELTLLFGHTRGTNPAPYTSASPLHQAAAGFAPTLLIHGTADATVPHEQSEKLAKKLDELQVPNQLVLLRDAPHAFKLREDAHDLRNAVLAFFDRYLKPAAAGPKTP